MRWVFLAVIRLELNRNGWEQIGIKGIEFSQYQGQNFRKCCLS